MRCAALAFTDSSETCCAGINEYLLWYEYGSCARNITSGCVLQSGCCNTHPDCATHITMFVAQFLPLPSFSLRIADAMGKRKEGAGISLQEVSQTEKDD
jgi:hypothetical protein